MCTASENLATSLAVRHNAGVSEPQAAFTGSVPENYDRFLGPALFDPYAAEIVRRLDRHGCAALLEVACGTGIVTEKLVAELPPPTRLVATDLSQPMIDYASRKLSDQRQIEWQTADATQLPFDDQSFDVVLCQFGFMFVPDKPAAFREAHRVLKPGGKLLFNVWDKLEHNDFCRIAHETVLSFFESDPPLFFEVPFGFHRVDEIRTLLEDAGFDGLRIEHVDLPSVSASARDAATGLIQGTPVSVAVRERSPGDLPVLTEAAALALTQQCGASPCRGKMRAIVCEATR